MNLPPRLTFLCAHLWFSPIAFGAPSAPLGGPLDEYQGPDRVLLDLLRPGTEKSTRVRIFVQATLPDGDLGLFLVDTGAAISVLSTEVAQRLKIPLNLDFGTVEGLGGRASYDRLVMPELALGPPSLNRDRKAVLENVEFAVGVPGVPETAGWMPLAGILGNNVWGRFMMEVDYPADRLVLHRPGTFKMPRRTAAMRYEGEQLFTAVRIQTKDTSFTPNTGWVVVQLDTGASGLMLSGKDALSFPIPASAYSEGIEPVFGVGAADTMPANSFLRQTRRIPLTSVELGGRLVRPDFEARWVNIDGGPAVGPSGLPGLAGHELMQNHKALFDFQGGRFALVKSHRRRRTIDGHRMLLAEDLARYGEDPKQGLYRSKMLIATEDWTASDQHLEGFLATEAPARDKAEARVLLSLVRRRVGDLKGANQALAALSAGELVAEGAVLAMVNGLILEGLSADALTLADAAIANPASDVGIDEDEVRSRQAIARVARADALVALARYEEANAELMESAKILDNPDAQLIRRARVALAQGDRFGALSRMRRLIQLFPSNGQYLWFYASLIETDDERETFGGDMETAVARLHPSDLPFDYLVEANRILGRRTELEKFYAAGVQRDCRPMDDRAQRDNCLAWYESLKGRASSQALDRIDRAIAKNAARSDFLDTKAMVHLSRGEFDLAQEAAMAAARLAPDDIYLLWQAERIRHRAVTEGLKAPHREMGYP